MQISEARSYDQGIEFLVRRKEGNIVIRGKRNLEGNILTECDDNISYEIFKTIVTGMLIILMTPLIICLKYVLRNHIYSCVVILEVLTIIWLSVILYAIYMTGQESWKSMYKYHGAGHKVLNYIQKYNEIPKTIGDLKNIGNLYNSCVITKFTVMLLAVTIVVLTFVFVPYLWLKIIVVLVLLSLLFVLWITGRCNFIQKCVVLEPTEYELEVAIEAMKLYEYVVD